MMRVGAFGGCNDLQLLPCDLVTAAVRKKLTLIHIHFFSFFNELN